MRSARAYEPMAARSPMCSGAQCRPSLVSFARRLEPGARIFSRQTGREIFATLRGVDLLNFLSGKKVALAQVGVLAQQTGREIFATLRGVDLLNFLSGKKVALAQVGVLAQQAVARFSRLTCIPRFSISRAGVPGWVHWRAYASIAMNARQWQPSLIQLNGGIELLVFRPKRTRKRRTVEHFLGRLISAGEKAESDDCQEKVRARSP